MSTQAHSTIESHAIHEPRWIGALVETCEDHLLGQGMPVGLGYRWYPPRTADAYPSWLITVYPKPGEAYAGQEDGQPVTASFAADLGPLLGAFATLDAVVYHGDPQGGDLMIRGQIMGRPVTVQVRATPLPESAAVAQVDLRTGEAWAKDAVQNIG